MPLVLLQAQLRVSSQAGINLAAGGLQENAQHLDNNGQRLEANGLRLAENGQRLAENGQRLEKALEGSIRNLEKSETSTEFLQGLLHEHRARVRRVYQTPAPIAEETEVAAPTFQEPAAADPAIQEAVVAIPNIQEPAVVVPAVQEADEANDENLAPLLATPETRPKHRYPTSSARRGQRRR